MRHSLAGDLANLDLCAIPGWRKIEAKTAQGETQASPEKSDLHADDVDLIVSTC
jgi:hypothetical protein